MATVNIITSVLVHLKVMYKTDSNEDYRVPSIQLNHLTSLLA
jgi:hypothetical protein